jgi:hypothetical protein
LEICSALEASFTFNIGQFCISDSNVDTCTFCHVCGAGEVVKAMDVDPLIVAMNFITAICGPTRFILRHRHLYLSYFDVESIVSVGGVRCDDDGISEDQTWVCIYDGNRIFNSYSQDSMIAKIALVGLDKEVNTTDSPEIQVDDPENSPEIQVDDPENKPENEIDDAVIP